MSHARNVFAVAVLAPLAWAVVPVAEAQAPIRIGATLAETGEQGTARARATPRTPTRCSRSTTT